MNTRDKRIANINKGRIKSNETNTIKGLITYIKPRTKKETYKNKLIDDLISTGYYKELYDKFEKNCEECDNYEYTDEEEEYNDMLKGFSDKDIKILELMEYKTPDEIESLKEGLKKVEEPVKGR